MSVAFDDRANVWVRLPGELTVGVDDDADLTLGEALFIADFYGGGEFDNECAGIVAALCVLRDHIKAVQS